ncbi:unnamed protein product [Brassica oleracea var. botrytis]
MLLISLRDGVSPPIKMLIFLKHRRDINPSIFSIWPSTWRSLSHAKWGMYMMNICEFPGVAVNHQLSELFVDGRVVIRDTTKVVKQNRPLHIEDPNKILARSVGVVDPSGWKQRKLKSSPYSAPNTDLALMACSLLILRAEVQCGRTRNQPWSLMRIFNVPQ